MKLTLALLVGLLAVDSFTLVETAPRLTRPAKTGLVFEDEAAGRVAWWDADWRILPDRPLGLVVAAARCDSEIFLLDRTFGAVRRVDLTRERLLEDLSRESLRGVAGIAADCDGRRLYATTADGVSAFDIDTGTSVRRYQQPAGFVNSVGAAVLADAGKTLIVPGLWSTAGADWVLGGVDRMFDGNRIGYRLDVATGRISPHLPAVDSGCWSLGPNCLYTTLDAFQGSASSGISWVAAHRVGMHVGLYESAGRLVRKLDVRSNMFRETGERNESRTTAAVLTWGTENSVIRDVYGFDGSIVTVHTVNRTTGWRRGDALDFDVFMNVHTSDGRGLIGDLRLPELPVGRDDEALYVVDYGPAGRRAAAAEPFSILRIPVDQSR